MGKFGLFLLVTMLAASPVLACMAHDAAMTAEESACCRHMASDCGQGSMPSSHSCCKRLPTADQVAMAKTFFNLSLQLHFLDAGEPQLTFAQHAHEAFLRVAALGHSPPETPPSSSEILRI